MSDRLAELRRQRSLVIEQLTWLDREIQRESGTPPAAPAAAVGVSATPTAASVPTPPAPAQGVASAATMTAETFTDFEVNPVSVHQDVKKGCFLYFAAAFVLLGALIALAYFTLGKR